MPFQLSERMLSLFLMVARRSTRFDTTPKLVQFTNMQESNQIKQTEKLTVSHVKRNTVRDRIHGTLQCLQSSQQHELWGDPGVDSVCTHPSKQTNQWTFHWLFMSGSCFFYFNQEFLWKARLNLCDICSISSWVKDDSRKSSSEKPASYV